ncbi:DUF262 and DUF1524 domain-containing protein [Metasolibacillus meyeri]|uniref:DUF262 and DUF1524 domain-containing protein n=1 Tax=Metasolibacillus meyeri TaxID=1071052 RepID=UPI000D30AC74|nr:DUF262 and DUF1524 domain-containing protein [Metasolibacillus meyeri]
MKASENNFLKFLSGMKQFLIPIYQRKYSWQDEQCEQLWHDIMQAADNSTGHFVGSVVYIEREIYTVSAIPQLLVIDGQQRLTTISLLLMALSKRLSTENLVVNDNITGKKLKNYYLVNNDEEDTDLYYRLVLTDSDDSFYKALLDDTPFDDEDNRVIENYRLFEEKINMLDASQLAKLYEGLSKLLVVDIALERGKDNPQLIFESLNSTGLDLSQTDLIRNYLLMDLEPQEQNKLYMHYWSKIEKRFNSANDAKLFDRFMRDYLTIKTEKIPNIDHIYKDFKKYVFENKIVVASLVDELEFYSKCYLAITSPKDVTNKQIQKHLFNISKLKVDVSYPFILEAYADLLRFKLTEDDFIELLKLIETYVLRRSICNVATNSLNKVFVALLKEVDKDAYLESIKVALITKKGSSRYPNDAEFIREFKTRNMYKMRNLRFLLEGIENYNRKEPISIADFTIEHVMPQNENISSDWQKELGSDYLVVHQNYLHTIGNLTLTAYNSSLSDKSFTLKKSTEKGFLKSPLFLNESIAQAAYWNKESIENRAGLLVKKALVIWSYPDIDQQTIDKYQPAKQVDQEIDFESFNNRFSKTTLHLYEQLKEQIISIDPATIKISYTKLYIAFKTITNFVDVIPYKSKLKLILNFPFEEVIDPTNIARDITNVGSWGNGDVEITIENPDQITPALEIIKQAYEYQIK